MIDKDLIITQQDLVDWIDRPPSNDDLDLCSYLSNAVKNQYEYHKEIERLNNIINELKWKPIEEYEKGNYDWVLIKYYDDDYECVPIVAEKRFDKWYSADEKEIIFEVKYFMDMQQIDKLQKLKGSESNE